MKKFYTPLLFISCAAVFAQEPLLVENFEYTAGDALTAHGWAAHSAADTNPVTVTAPGLSFAGYIASGTGNAAGVNNTGQDVNKPFTSAANTTVYASFLVNVTASTADEYFFLLGANPITTAFRARIYAQPVDDATFKFGLSFNASTPQTISDVVFTYGQTYLVVSKYTAIEGDANDTVSLYVFAAGADFETEPATALIGPLTGTAADLTPGTVGLRQFNADQLITVDGIVVANQWDIYQEVSGLEDNALNKAVLYPNPANNGQLHINNLDGGTVALYNIEGRLVLTAAAETVNVSALTAGMYIAKVTTQSGVATQKILINN